MSSPKPIPTRRGTLFGLRRKSSVASLSPSIPVVSPPTEAPVMGEPSSSTLPTPEPSTSNDATSINSKTQSPKPKRKFTSLIPTRTSTDGPSSESGVLSDAGSDHSINLHPKSSSRSASFLRRLSSSSSGKKHALQIEELQQAKTALEAQVDVLTTEKVAQAESQRLSLEDTRTKEEWDEERRKIIDEAAAQLVAKEVDVKSLNNTIEELKEELERQRSLRSPPKSTPPPTLEKEGLEKQLLEAQTSLDAKDRALKELESHSSGLKDQLASAEAGGAKVEGGEGRAGDREGQEAGGGDANAYEAHWRVVLSLGVV
ncbi:hypothetical protein FA13DRAFT_1705037 [Coprinellus micaceus]|uniref:Uncharacterized protein n=1 Tax=Coprinellus micaceus TaxID=71717 RepID=A0A4Y7TWM6_COPMI|nr:hypothetical protein FA13DRAFT_1705037 [Coprinellus micaceus]